MSITEIHRRIFRSNFHSILLLFFFVLHGWNDFFELIGSSSIIKLLVFFVIISLIYFYLSLFLIRSRERAALFTTFSFSFFLFYALVEKFLLSVAESISISISKFIVGFVIVVAFFFFLLVKKEWKQVITYINSLLGLLIIVELCFLVSNLFSHKHEMKPSFTRSAQSVGQIPEKPSVYLILLDEYAGEESLKEQMNFDNFNFLNSLEAEQEFQVLRNTRSNYGNTVPSIASILNGEYINFPKGRNLDGNNRYRVAMGEIYNCRVVQTFKELGYKIENYSPFSIKDAPYGYTSRFIPVDVNLILNPTIFDDIIDLMPLFIARRLKMKYWVEKLVKEKIADNFLMMDEVLKNSLANDSTPTFCYLHLLMPHSPFAVDSVGKINVKFFIKETIHQGDKNDAYLQYLKYTNTVVLEFIKKLKKNTGSKAVILLMSDHGSRDLAVGGQNNESYNNLNAVYYPKKTTVGWYNGMSNVNQFRILFSEITGTKIPLLKDSIAY